MNLRSLAYTSHAAWDLQATDLESIHRTARESNALNGVTGLLVFNGTHFLQVIEGAEAAIDDLLERVRRDRRHSGLEVIDERTIENRSFPDWSMELMRVESSYFEAKKTIKGRIPATLAPEVLDRIYRFTKAISGTIKL